MAMEDKHLRFKRLAEARTQKVLDTIDLIGNLSNKSFYSFSEDEVKEIFNAIRKAADDNEDRFLKKGKKGKRFTL